MQSDVLTTSPRKLDAGSYDLDGNPQRVYVQLMITGPGTLYYGSQQAEITSSSTDPTQLKGLQIVSNDGVVRFWWNGPLWAACNIPTPITWDIKQF